MRQRSESDLYVAGLTALRRVLSPADWERRRATFEKWRQLSSTPDTDPYPGNPRPTDDEFAWYLFVVETALQDPYALDPNEAARILPIVTGFADRWDFAPKIIGLDQKLADLAGPRRHSPDSGLFEVAIALAYAATGFQVTLIPEQPGIKKTPDLKVSKSGIDVFVECKRQSKYSAYEGEERAHWQRLWAPLKHLLHEVGNPVWLRIEFRKELSSYTDMYLTDRLRVGIAMTHVEMVLIDDEYLKVEAKPTDMDAVRVHLNDVYVKVGGTQECALLGQSWAPARANMESSCRGVRMRPSQTLPPWKARSFWDEIHWGCGVSWVCSAEAAIERKARDIKALFARAIEQLPDDQPGIVHIAAETLSGNDVELRRTEKIMSSIKNFQLDKPVIGLLFHRIQSESPPDGAFNFDESVSDFWMDEKLRHEFPHFAFVPRTTETRPGGHWDYY